ncbi:MAG: hypothetical protein IIB83_04150 [Bacteroidetes bacterium]|nr:hypothetical protein [Bacteroidota bacterium]
MIEKTGNIMMFLTFIFVFLGIMNLMKMFNVSNNVAPIITATISLLYVMYLMKYTKFGVRK